MYVIDLAAENTYEALKNNRLPKVAKCNFSDYA
jgi:hypothetical protein